MRELHLFTGAGGGILGGKLLGHTCVCAVELDKYCQKVLLQRQRDGDLDWFPIWDDVRTFDGKPWRGKVDVICGGFPCQDISSAGKGAGISGERSGLWKEFARIISEVRPRYCFIENSPNLTSRGLDVVLGDLSAMGFDAEWGVVGAHHTGAPHKRDRIWVLASNANNLGGIHQCGTRAERGRSRFDLAGGSWSSSEDVAATEVSGLNGGRVAQLPSRANAPARCGEAGAAWWATEPGLGRVAHGVAHRVDRLRAIGNGQVPQAAALAWRILYARLGK